MSWARKNILRLNDDDIKSMDKEMESEQEDYIAKAEHDGTLAGATQTAQQVYLQQNAPAETQEAPTSNGENK
jgi:hypothetical protein